MHSVKYCTAKFAHRVHKEAGEYRSLSLVALNANCNRKTAWQEASANKRLVELLGGIPLLVHIFAGSSVLQRMLRPCFMSVFKFTRVRVDGRKRYENGYVWTR